MKNLVLITSGVLFPLVAFAGDSESSDSKFWDKKINLEYQNEDVNNGTYQTRKTDSYSVSGVITTIGDGELSVGYIRRNEDRKKVLSLGELKGNEKSNILSLKYVKVEPSWGFWGGVVAYGRGSQDINIKYIKSTDIIDSNSASSILTKVNNPTGAYSVDKLKMLGEDQPPISLSDYFFMQKNSLEVSQAFVTALQAMADPNQISNAKHDLGVALSLYAPHDDPASTYSVLGNSAKDRVGKTLKGNKGSTLTSYTAFAGTKFSASGIDLIPMVKYTVNNKKMDNVSLISGEATSLFGIKSAKEKSFELSLTAQTKIDDGTLSLNATSVDTKGTNVIYTIKPGLLSSDIIDNPTKRRAMSYKIGYNLPLNKKTSLDVSWKSYKNAESTTKTIYVGIGYTF